VQVAGPRELEAAMVGLLDDPVRRASLGAAARALVEASRGARDRTLRVFEILLPPAAARGAVVHPFRPVH
jgi:hypothetical protein